MFLEEQKLQREVQHGHFETYNSLSNNFNIHLQQKQTICFY